MRIEIAIIIMLVIDVLLFLSQSAVTHIAQEEGVIAPTFHQYQGSVLSQYDVGNYTLTNNVSRLLPSGQGEVVPNTGNFFTDIFSTAKNWFLDLTGVKYFIGVVNAVPNTIKNIGFEPEIAFAIGALWHILTFILIISWLFNR